MRLIDGQYHVDESDSRAKSVMSNSFEMPSAWIAGTGISPGYLKRLMALRTLANACPNPSWSSSQPF